jgi:hypothetical protein
LPVAAFFTILPILVSISRSTVIGIRLSSWRMGVTSPDFSKRASSSHRRNTTNAGPAPIFSRTDLEGSSAVMRFNMNNRSWSVFCASISLAIGFIWSSVSVLALFIKAANAKRTDVGCEVDVDAETSAELSTVEDEFISCSCDAAGRLVSIDDIDTVVVMIDGVRTEAVEGEISCKVGLKLAFGLAAGITTCTRRLGAWTEGNVIFVCASISIDSETGALVLAGVF